MSTPAPPQARPPLSVQRAVEAAQAYLLTFFPQAQGLRLEEIERTEDDRYFLITLGFREDPSQLIAPLLHAPTKLKVFKVDASSGEVRSMKSREPS